MRVALQPADTKLQAWFAKAVVVISVLRGLSLRVRIYVIPLMRTSMSIRRMMADFRHKSAIPNR